MGGRDEEVEGKKRTGRRKRGKQRKKSGNTGGKK